MITPLTADHVSAVFANEFPDFAHSQASWRGGYEEITRAVRQADPGTFQSSAFQEHIWDSNPISTLGPGSSVTVKGAYTDRGLAAYLLSLRDTPLIGTPDDRGHQLNKAFDDILQRVRPHNARQPKARIVRLLAALYPADMCSILDARRVWEVSQLLGLPAYKHGPVAQHPVLRDALRAMLLSRHPGATDVEQSMLLWFLWERFCKQSAGPKEEPPRGPEHKAPPFALSSPQAQRQSLQFISNNVAVLVAMMREAENGLTRADLSAVIQREAPQLKSTGSVNITFSQAQGGLGLLELANGSYRPTATGRDLLAAPDPAIVLQPVLIGRVFGVGHLLLELNENDGALPRKELRTRLAHLFPSYTTERGAGALIEWAVAVKLVTIDGEMVRLTDEGDAYAEALPDDFRTTWVLPERPKDPPPAVLDNSGKPPSFHPAPWPTLQASFASLGDAQRLVLPPALLGELHAALHASTHKRFVLLAGLSGTGKTSIARAYAAAYCGALGVPEWRTHYAQVAVRPDWTDPAGMLGFRLPQDDGDTFQRGEVVDLLLDAADNPTLPYFLCLDEMNLARVEHYFAPFLSAMESPAGTIVLHTDDSEIGGVPPGVTWPSNLFIFGTVNMDESTHPFSDKVLDRAFTFEFWDVDLATWHDRRAPGTDAAALVDVYPLLQALHDALAPARRQFGYRVADEVLDFCSQDVGATRDALLDAAILAKVLPRLRGDDGGPLATALDAMLTPLPHARFPRARAKVQQMRHTLKETGQAKFWS